MISDFTPYSDDHQLVQKALVLPNRLHYQHTLKSKRFPSHPLALIAARIIHSFIHSFIVASWIPTVGSTSRTNGYFHAARRVWVFQSCPVACFATVKCKTVKEAGPGAIIPLCCSSTNPDKTSTLIAIISCQHAFCPISFLARLKHPSCLSSHSLSYTCQ